MTRVRLCACTTIAIFTALLLTGAASARTLLLEYHVHDLRAPGDLSITYHTGLDGTSGSLALAQRGGIGLLSVVDNGIQLHAAGSEALTATVSQFVQVGTAPITGTAEIPSGATATVRNTLTGETTTLSNGSFSIATGVVAIRRKKDAASYHAGHHRRV